MAPAIATQDVIGAWVRQLREDVSEFVSPALRLHAGCQVVLFVGDDGKVGKAKVTITTQVRNGARAET